MSLGHPLTTQHSNIVPLFNEFLLLLAWQNTPDKENKNLFNFFYCFAASFLCSDQLPTQVVARDGDGRELLYQPSPFSGAAVTSSFTRTTRKGETEFYSSLPSSFLAVNRGTHHVMR